MPKTGFFKNCVILPIPGIAIGGSPGGSLGGSSGVKHITKSKKIHFYIIHIILDKINVNLNELSLNLVNLVGSADALQGVGGRGSGAGGSTKLYTSL